MDWKLTFRIDLESDYHIGAGHGLGPSVDSALHRDADGVPVLSGSTLKGLLRAGLGELLELMPLQQHGLRCRASGLPDRDAQDHETPRFCGQYDPEDADCPVCRIFGSPRTQKKWRFGSARPDGMPTPLQRHWTPGQSAGQPALHVRVSPRTRRAEEGKLFSREEGDARLNFVFTLTRAGSDGQAAEEAAWLVAAARMVRRLGASRRRGQGDCRIHLDSAEGDGVPKLGQGKPIEDWFLAQFARLCLHQGAVASTPALEPFVPSASLDQGRVRVRLVARLDQPLIVSAKGEAGNEFHTIDYVPGSAVRGALASLVTEHADLEDHTSTAYKAFVRLFFREAVQFPYLLPAHYAAQTITPTVPAPLDLLGCELYDAHAPVGLALTPEPACLTPLCPTCEQEGHRVEAKPWGDFVSVRPGLDHCRPQHTVEIHPSIDRNTQRAAKGQLFGLDVLQAGQYFCGELACRSWPDWEDLCHLCGWDPAATELFVPLRFGKEHSSCGQTLLWVHPQDKDTPDPWCPLLLAQRVTDVHAPFVLTLLTDTIGLDRWGRFHRDLDAAWLSQELKVRVSRVPETRMFCATREVDAFNAYLGLPRWRDTALRAGSAVGLQVEEDVSLEELRKRLGEAEERGIGIRRNEGYGRFAINHPLYQRCEQVTQSSYSLPVEMRLAPMPAGSLHTETEFRSNWSAHLAAQDWHVFSKAEFESLARLLRTETPANVEEIEALGQTLGIPAGIVDEQVLVELRVRNEEKQKINFFTGKETGKAGLAVLKTLAQSLAGKAGANPRCWQVGVEMLADRIATEARKEDNR